MTTQRSTAYHYLGSLLSAFAVLFLTLYLLFIVFNLGDVGLGRVMSNPISWLVILGWIAIAPVAAVIYFKRNKQQDALEYINRSVLRYAIAFLMFFYGYTKIYHKFFDITYLTQDSRVADVPSFDMAWYFFGRSNIQEIMIGVMEFVPAILLLFRRTLFPAIAIMLPIAANVMMVNIFNRISGLTFPLSVFITCSLTYLLYGYKDQIRQFLATIEREQKAPLNKALNSLRMGFKVLVVGMITYIGVGSLFNKVSGRSDHDFVHHNKFTGGYELQELTVNGLAMHPDTGNLKYYKAIYLEPQSRWNKVMTFATQYAPRAITVRWNPKNDSVHTWIKLSSDVSQDAVDSTTGFAGTYVFQGDKLVVAGLQYGVPIYAVYKKKPLKDYNWFW